MSAIFGIINKNGEPVEDEMIEKMQSSLLHRAVDGSGVIKAGNMMFGHHKLTVHRRQANEKQPLQLDDLVITCDARIDNIEELFVELKLEKTTENFTDPFIILQAYKMWGDDCVKHLEGEFCFGIWNVLSGCFFAASDHIGFRTFYFYDNDEFFLFANEIRAIEAIKSEPLKIDIKVFAFDSTNTTNTYDVNIKQFQPSHFLRIRNRKIEIKRFWEATKLNKYYSKKELYWKNIAIDLLNEKITHLLETDYPVGIALSGGLDSSLIAALACKILKKQNRKLYAFCSVLPLNYSGPGEDERFYIEILKKSFDNLEVIYITIPEEEGFYSNLESAFENAEGPIPLFHYVDSEIYKAAKLLQIRTMLSGFGGDETISNSGRDVIYFYFSKLKILTALKLFYQKYKIGKRSLISQLKIDIISNFPIYNNLRDVLKSLSRNKDLIPWDKKKKKQFLTDTKVKKPSYYINQGITGFVLYKIKKGARPYNIEYACPIYSKDMFEFFLDIPPFLFLRNGKQRNFIKTLMKGRVPDEIWKRDDKTSFSPDHEERILKINSLIYNELLENKKEISKYTGIDFQILNELINNYQFNINNEKTFYPIYISSAIISGAFLLWLIKKNHFV